MEVVQGTNGPQRHAEEQDENTGALNTWCWTCLAPTNLYRWCEVQAVATGLLEEGTKVETVRGKGHDYREAQEEAGLDGP